MLKKILVPYLLLFFLGFCYFLAPKFPEIIQTVYHQKFYRSLDFILHPIFNGVRFSIGDILYLIIVLFIVYKIFILLKSRKYKTLSMFLFNTILIFMSFFQLFWGLNNYKLSITYQLGLEQQYSQEELDATTQNLIQIVNYQQREIMQQEDLKVHMEKDLALFNKIAIENYANIQEPLHEILLKNKINSVKPSLFSTFQSYAGFSGYFNPFTHENQVNIEIPTIGMPITVAHEMAHQLGIASESEANFLGYQNMKRSSDVRYQYAANLYALKYCLKEYRYKNEEKYLELFTQLHLGVQQNITDSEAFWLSKRNFSSFFFKHLYGRFLKINNQKDGMKSYNKFVDLLINYNKKYPEI